MLSLPSEMLSALCEPSTTVRSSRALSSSKGWTVDSYSVAGEGAYAETYSIPGMEVYVMRPDMSDVNEAKAKIEAVLSEN